MSGIPRGVLSERFQEVMEGKRLLSAAFLTFRFDPAFFEQEILPVFLDIPLSHASVIKLVQLEDALKSLPGQIVVYYDQNGLVAEASSSRLDIRRIPVRCHKGIFHPKNVFLLVEDIEPDDEGHRARALLVASMSANLTRAGWWENVEACHIEVIEDGDFTRLRTSLRKLLRDLDSRYSASAAPGASGATADIQQFLKDTEQREKRSSGGLLHTHFFHKPQSVVDFLREASRGSLLGMNLEVISPYLAEGAELTPLRDLIDAFQPREVRVFLPRDDDGTALCKEQIYNWVESQPGVTWGQLPKDLLSRGRAESIQRRVVHAKVYRFFSSAPKREIIFLGSVNLTTPAFQNGGNMETGFLVEVEPAKRPEWWLEEDRKKPRAFHARSEDEGTASGNGTQLSLAYWWNTGTAKAYWDAPEASPPLAIEGRGIPLFSLAPIPGGQWIDLDAAASTELAAHLKSSSIVSVRSGKEDVAMLLVQEEGMSHRPSLLLDLSPAEILRYWSLLTAEQRAAFIEDKGAILAQHGEGLELITRQVINAQHDTMFDRFAGVFHAFGCLERSAREALEHDHDREANYRLFGQKYDSLGNLLNRVLKDNVEEKGDLVEHYMIALCTRQLLDEVARDFPEYWAEHRDDAAVLRTQLDALSAIRDVIIARNSTKHPDMGQFMDWLDKWFLKRAEPAKLPAEIS